MSDSILLGEIFSPWPESDFDLQRLFLKSKVLTITSQHLIDPSILYVLQTTLAVDVPIDILAWMESCVPRCIKSLPKKVKNNTRVHLTKYFLQSAKEDICTKSQEVRP